MSANDTSTDMLSLEAILPMLDSLYPRLISQIDRDPDSPTYGSCDRGFWMYRLHDFDSGVLQQAALTLAALDALCEIADLSAYRNLDSGPREYLRSLSHAINQRTLLLLSRTGFLDEYYPGERSYPATVFGCHALLKSAQMVGRHDIIDSPALERTASLLLDRGPSPAANQDAAAAAFLSLYSKLRNWKRPEVERAVRDLLAGPDRDHAFLEYGGFDVGYSTVTLNYLAFMVEDGTYPANDLLERLAARIAEFVTPAGALGGEFASRSTTYFLPFGFIAAISQAPHLAAPFNHLELAAVVAKLDDRYLMHYFLPSLAMSALKLAREGSAPHDAISASQPMAPRSVNIHGIQIWRHNRNALFVGLNKGGTFHLESAGRTSIDCGYRVRRGGSVYATCVMDNSGDHEVVEEHDRIQMSVRAHFRRYASLTASPIKTVILRAMRLLGPRLNAYFKARLIQRPQTLEGATFLRRIVVDRSSHTVTVHDVVQGLKTSDYLSVSPPSSFRLVPSAKLHQPGEEWIPGPRLEIDHSGCYEARRVIDLSSE